MTDIVTFEEIYSWQNDHDQSIFVDGPNGVLIYQNVYDKSLRVIETNVERFTFKTTRFNKPLCEAIAFSPDGRFLLYWYNNPSTIGLAEIFASEARDVLVDSSAYEETIVLSLFWVEPNESNGAEFVVVCTSCIDIYHFSYLSLSVRRICSKRISCTDVWNDISGTHIVLLRNNHTLQPYHIQKKVETRKRSLTGTQEVRLVSEIELAFEKPQKIQKSDICIANIYGEVYCVYKETENGRISLRSLTDSKALDIVLEVKCQKWLDIVIIDNLLLALTGSGETYIFDIYLSDGRLIAKFPQRKPPISAISSDIQAYIPNVIVDYYGGFAYKLLIDHDMLVLNLSRSSTEALVLDFYQRRKGALPRVMDIVLTAITKRTPLDRLFIIFSTAVIPYYRSLLHVDRFGKEAKNAAALPFHLVEEFLGGKSVITEYRMGMSILYPLVTRDWKIHSGVNLYDAAIVLMCYHMGYNYCSVLEVQTDLRLHYGTSNNHILRSHLIHKEDGSTSFDVGDYFSCEDTDVPEIYDEDERGAPEIISITMCYFKALNMHHLFPSPFLQILLFDICFLYNNIGQALRLIKNGVIRDSPYVCYRLFYLYVLIRDQAIRQSCRDMAIRAKQHDICVALGLTDREYYNTLVFLKTNNLCKFPIYKILYKAANDIEKQTETPQLLPMLLAYTRNWYEQSKTKPHVCGTPNLRNCERWLPDL